MATTTDESSDNDKAREAMEAARSEVMECEREIQNIKLALRQVGSSSSSGGGEEASNSNSLQIRALEITGLPEAAQPRLSLQLSSPVEELELTKLYSKDDDDDGGEQKEEDGTVAVFSGVETSMATLTVTARDSDVAVLGRSKTHDVQPWCEFDAQHPETKVSEIKVDIFPSSEGSVFKDALDNHKAAADGDETEDKVEGTIEEEGGAAKKESDTKQQDETKDNDDNDDGAVPICTITLQVEYHPSPKDIREELYDLLNKASKRKTQAIDQLRKSAAAVSRSGGGGSSASTAVTPAKSRAVQPGFLNKKEKEPGYWQKLYQRTIGPNSLLRRVAPVAKNYVIFFGAVVLFHFKGQELALPPPV